MANMLPLALSPELIPTSPYGFSILYTDIGGERFIIPIVRYKG